MDETFKVFKNSTKHLQNELNMQYRIKLYNINVLMLTKSLQNRQTLTKSTKPIGN